MNRRKDIAQAQLVGEMVRAMRCHAEIVSGEYKKKTTEQGTAGPGGELAFRPMTDDEKLEYMMAQLRSHERIVGELVEFIENFPEENVQPTLPKRRMFTLRLNKGSHRNKIQVIKEIRSSTGFNLRESKLIADEYATDFFGITLSEIDARLLAGRLTVLGCEVDIKQVEE